MGGGLKMWFLPHVTRWKGYTWRQNQAIAFCTTSASNGRKVFTVMFRFWLTRDGVKELKVLYYFKGFSWHLDDWNAKPRSIEDMRKINEVAAKRYGCEFE